MLTASKQELINTIHREVSTAVATQMCSINYTQVNNVSVSYVVECAIVAGITEAVRLILENVYTDEEMERDLTLR